MSVIINDPRTLPEGFYLVSKSSTTDLVSFLIQWRTGGMWNHSMGSRTQGKFFWQGMQIREAGMESYMKKGISLDFFTLSDINPQALQAMNDYLNKRMAGKWWTQLYDWWGIVGQAIGDSSIHTPGLDYCSVLELAVLRSGALYLPKSGPIILAQKAESNPQDLHDMYVANPSAMPFYGRYDADQGVIV